MGYFRKIFRIKYFLPPLVILAVLFIMILIGYDKEAVEVGKYVRPAKFAAGIVVFFVCVVYKCRYYLARKLAYDIKTEIFLHPSDRPHHGTIEMQIYNRGDSDIAISYAGFADYRWEEAKNILGKQMLSKLSYCLDLDDPALESRFPIYIQKGDIATLEFVFDDNKFEGEFHGLYYIIDLDQSEQNNMQAQRLSAIRQDCDGLPPSLNVNIVKDNRLHPTFVKRRSRRHRRQHS